MFLQVDEIISVRRGYIIRVINVTHFEKQASNVSLTFMDLWISIYIKFEMKMRRGFILIGKFGVFESNTLNQRSMN